MSVIRSLAAALCLGLLSSPVAAQDCEARGAAVSAHAATFSEMVAGAQAMMDTLRALMSERALPLDAAERLMQHGSLPMTEAIVAAQARLEGELAALARDCPD